MKKVSFVLAVLTLTLFAVALAYSARPPSSADFGKGTPKIQSMSALEFSSDGVLFIGDSKSGTVFAIDLQDKTANNSDEQLSVPDIENKIASMLGTTADEILIHDLAVNPISKNAYLAVSRGRTKWESRWSLPNELDDAKIIFRVTANAKIEEVSLQNVNFSKASLPNPVSDDATHQWKEGIGLRVDAITDMVYSDGKLYVAGLSNEEFASTMWQIPFPFEGNATFTTLEIFHGAHGEYETNAPIRTFLPYEVNDEPHMLASYLCTPMVTFPIADMKDGTHLKGKTVSEFGSGNYPLDMLVYEKSGKDYILMANSALPLMIIDPDDIEKQKVGITSEVPGYTAGVPYVTRSAGLIQQIDNFNSQFVLGLQRTPAGKLDLISMPIRRL
jgi:hypothetical protein